MVFRVRRIGFDVKGLTMKCVGAKVHAHFCFATALEPILKETSGKYCVGDEVMSFLSR